MIKKIKYIKDFGVFKDFNWNASLSDFKNFNLIYAWNYSGKTTLSRVLRSFETQKIHEDFLKAQYELELSDGSTAGFNDLANHSVKVRVFNTDFVSSQLRWDYSDSIEPIFILGEENI
jgi:wobble nucleotide-excising tRNase